MLASLAATGMLLVFAMSTVLCMSGLPLLGSLSSGNSVSTSVISFPLSPHPTYMMTSASLHFASWCCITVLPLPKGPGTPAVPPLATGKKVSTTRWPVTSGSFDPIFSLYGDAFLTDLVCIIFTSAMPSLCSTFAIQSLTVNLPPLMLLSFPLTPKGAIM